jgi:hypothetical protein
MAIANAVPSAAGAGDNVRHLPPIVDDYRMSARDSRASHARRRCGVAFIL